MIVRAQNYYYTTLKTQVTIIIGKKLLEAESCDIGSFCTGLHSVEGRGGRGDKWEREGERKREQLVRATSDIKRVLLTALVSEFHFFSLQSIPSTFPLHPCREKGKMTGGGRGRGRGREAVTIQNSRILTCSIVQLHHHIWRAEVSTYLLSRPIVDCHEVLSVFLQKRQFLAAILLSDDVEGFPSSRETFADCARAFPAC